MPGPLAVAGLAGGLSLLGGIIGNRNRSREAAKDRQFQAKMSSTAWQRGVRDMEKAGINPALAYSQGGASSPGGAMASQSDVISPAVDSAKHGLRLKKELQMMDEQITATYNKGRLDANLGTESAARRQHIYKQQEATEIQNKLGNLSLFSAKNVANMQNTQFGRILPYMQSIMGMTPRLNLGAALVGRGGTSTTRTTGGRYGPTESITTRGR